MKIANKKGVVSLGKVIFTLKNKVSHARDGTVKSEMPDIFQSQMEEPTRVGCEEGARR